MRVSHSYQSIKSLTEVELITLLKEAQLQVPVTEDEIDAFIDAIGETKVELPEGFRSAEEYFRDFIGSKKGVFAMAAQRQKKGGKLPTEVVNKLRVDMSRNDNLVKPENDGISE